MPLGFDNTGGRRDQPERIPLVGDVLRREVERLGFVQGPINVATLATGTADDSTYLRGDGTWAHIEAVRFPVKNASGGTLAKGTPVYIIGSVGASPKAEVAAAEASNAAKMPCVGLLEEELLNNGEGFATSLGVLRGVNTSGYAVNQVVFVGGGGGLTGTRPTAAGTLVQNIGRVLHVGASTGEILVMGPGRTNDVPNYTASRLLGRGTSGDGAAQEITIGTGLSLSGTTLNATGGSGGGSITNGDYTASAGFLLGRADAAPGQAAIQEINLGKGLEFLYPSPEIRVANLGIDTPELKAAAVTYAKIQNVSATDRLLGRSSAGAGVVEEITCTAAGRALLDDVDAAAQRATLGITGNRGSTEIDFGAFPGGSDAEVTVTGQTGILATSNVQAWIVAQPTIDHTADEHRLETISVCVGNIVPNTSFTIYAQNTSQLNEPVTAASVNLFRSAATSVYGDSRDSIGGLGTRIYGAWTVHWRWS